MEGRVDLGYLAVRWLGVELEIQVRHSNHYLDFINLICIKNTNNKQKHRQSHLQLISLTVKQLLI